MESSEARKQSPGRRRTNRKRRSSGDRVDHHARAGAMVNPKPSANATLARRDRSAARYEDSTYGSEATEEDAPTPDAGKDQQASPKLQHTPLHIPSEAELARLQLYVQLKAQAEGIQTVQGHSYSEVKVNGNAIVFAGNAHDSDRPEQQIIARRHQYRKFEARGSSVVLTGDMTHKGMAFFINQQRSNRGNHRHYGD